MRVSIRLNLITFAYETAAGYHNKYELTESV